jgi:hypothetical protein
MGREPQLVCSIDFIPSAVNVLPAFEMPELGRQVQEGCPFNRDIPAD